MPSSEALPGTGPEARPAPVSLRQAAAFWLKLGCISFGGPAGQIALMHSELVVRRRWISERRFLHALNYCMVLPGPEAQQLATYIGWLMHRHWGGMVAGGLFVLPSFFLLVALSGVYMAYGHTAVVAGLFFGIKPAVTAIVVQAVFRIGSRALKDPLLWGVAGLSFAATALAHLPFPLIVLGAALIGVQGGRIAPQRFAGGVGHGPVQALSGPAWIDDDTPTAPHARYNRKRLAGLAVIGAALWLGPMALLTARFGWQGTLTQMGWFFTKAALLTFGGAYAVLPYVQQAAVGHHGWLSAPQMMDGLALGETTPGPLIMVVAFVGFIGGHHSTEVQAAMASALGLAAPAARFMAGAVAAGIVTWFTFLPSFLFIFAGGPLVESTQHSLKLTAPLTAITAAVVGVILNLAWFFAVHLLWPAGDAGPFDARSAGIAVAAGVALMGFQRSVISVIAACALAGLALQTLG